MNSVYIQSQTQKQLKKAGKYMLYEKYHDVI